jgi:hypothetical protein
MPLTPTRDVPTRILLASVVGCVLAGLSGASEGGDAANRQTAPGDAAKKALGAIAGYRTNRESFTAFSCRFKWAYGTARSIEAARRGELDDKLEHDGLWLVDGQRVRYDLVCTSVNLGDGFNRAANNARGAKGAVVQTRGVEHFYLKNDRIRARQSKIIKTINLFPVEMPDDGIDVTPFSLGVMGGNEILNPAALLQDVVDGRVSGQFTDAIEEHGRPLAAIAAEGKGERARWDYRLDPGRGYLPMHFWKSDPNTGKTYYEAFVLEAKDCGSSRWFPTRAIVVMGDRDAPWPKRVREMHVTELKLEPPDSKDFFLDLSSGTRVVDSRLKNVFTMPDDTRVYESQLESLVERAAEHRAAREQARQVGIAMTLSGRWPLRRLLLINGIVIALLAAAVIWRKYKMPTR